MMKTEPANNPFCILIYENQTTLIDMLCFLDLQYVLEGCFEGMAQTN